MTKTNDPLALYDFTRERLLAETAHRLPAGVDPAAFCAETAYWISLAVITRGEAWETAFQRYTETAKLSHTDLDVQAEQREVALLRQELTRARGPLLDVGAGWGRMAPLYAQVELSACFVEPSRLGTRLMRRNDLGGVVAGKGEALPFLTGTFHTLLIGWVLHHDAGDVNARHLLRETARVTAPGGLLLSVEPLDDHFDAARWTALITEAGFAVRRIDVFYEEARTAGEISRHALLIGIYSPAMVSCASGLATP